MAVARDNSVASHNSSSASFTANITVTPGASILVVELGGGTAVLSAGAAAMRISSIDVAGTPLVRVLTDTLSGTGEAAEIYVYLNPPSGAITVNFVRAAGGYGPLSYIIRSYTGSETASTAAAITGFTKQSVTSGGSAFYTGVVNVLNGADDMTCSILTANNQHSVCAVTAGFQTADGSVLDANNCKLRSGYQVGAGVDVTHSYDLQADAAGRAAWLYSYRIVKAPAGGGGGNPAGIQACLVTDPKLVGGRMAV